MNRFCECGRLSVCEKDGKAYCLEHFKHPPKPKRIKGHDFSGDSQWRREMGMFQAKERT